MALRLEMLKSKVQSRFKLRLRKSLKSLPMLHLANMVVALLTELMKFWRLMLKKIMKNI